MFLRFPKACAGNYVTSTSTGAIVPGDTDTGNDCDDCTTAIPLPFAVSFYGTSYNIFAVVSSNGSLQFTSDAPFFGTFCPYPDVNFGATVFAYQDDLRTDNANTPDCVNFASGCGIFTSVTGTAPNREFHIEWRTGYFGRAGTANFEIRFYEGQSSFFDIFYGATADDGSGEGSGVQASATGPATNFSCEQGVLTNGLKVTYTCAAGPTPTPTATATATATPTGSPTCTPGGSPGPWVLGNPYPTTIVRYGFAQTATHFYVFGGVSDGSRVTNVNRMDIATGAWEARAPMPFESEAPTCALMEATGIVYCAEGDTGSGFASYDIAANTWTPLAAVPGGNHYGSASGAFNGKVFVAGGQGLMTNAVQVYEVATNTWSAGTAAPSGFLLAGYQQVGQHLYVVGGWTGGAPNGLMTTWRLDMSSAPGVWENGPAFPPGRADFGLAYDPGTNSLYALGGDLCCDGLFFNSTDLVDSLDLSGWPSGTWVTSPPNLPAPNRQANQAGFYGNGDIWSVGGINGATFQFLAEVLHRSNGGPCPTPSPTPTATVTPTATATPTATPTPTGTPGVCVRGKGIGKTIPKRGQSPSCSLATSPTRRRN